MLIRSDCPPRPRRFFGPMRGLALLLCLGWVSACEPSQSEPEAIAFESSEFTRFVEHDKEHATLDTSIAIYENDKGQRVDLISVVHVGDQGYYELLNRIFKAYDAVLYEMIKPKNADPTQLQEGTSMISTLQRGIKSLLGLDFQLDVVDYSAKNFVHADLDPSSFFEQQEEAGESIWGIFLQSMMKEFSLSNEERLEQSAQSYAIALAFMSKDRPYALKRIMGGQFGEMEKMLATFGTSDPEKGSVILEGRNTQALKVLRESLKKGDKKVSIFFGAAHMPDLEERLINEFGFKKTDEKWLTAWEIKPSRKKKDS